MQIKSKYIIILLFFLILVSINVAAYPFFGGFLYSSNYFENNKFNTINLTSFYLSQNINNNLFFYTRLTAGFKFYTDILKYESQQAYIVNEKNFAAIPSIDLMFLEFRSKKIDLKPLLPEEELNKVVNYDLFMFRLGRIPITLNSSMLLSSRMDGFDSFFSIKNFKFRIFTTTNSLDYMPFFNFQDSSSNPVFTKWDVKRIPPLSNRLIKNNIDGFIGDISSNDFNFFFNEKLYQDYSVEEKERLNKLRYTAVLAGRIFTGFSADLLQIYFQNFSIGFLANIDLIPEEFIIVYPSQIAWSNNTFAGRYNSFYINFKAEGKIINTFYYNFEAIYETGVNTGYYDTGTELVLTNKAIHSFALHGKFTYIFENIVTPIINLGFFYGHGDKNVEFIDDAIVIKNTKYPFDHNFRSPTSPALGYALEPKLSNIAVIILSNSIKPFAFAKNPIFSRFLIETALLIFTRPVIGGATFISEKSEYLKGGEKQNTPEKAYLGTEFDIFLKWAIFSDLKVELKNGIFIPNGKINSEGYTPYWRIGLMFNISF